MKNVAYLLFALSWIVSCAQPLVSPTSASGTGTATISIPTRAPWLTRVEKLSGTVAALKGHPAVTSTVSSAATTLTSAASRAFLQAAKVIVHVKVQDNGVWSDLAVPGNPYLLSSISMGQDGFSGQEYLTGTISGIPADVGYRLVAEVYANLNDSAPSVIGMADNVEISQYSISNIPLKCLPLTTTAVNFTGLDAGQTSVSVDVPLTESREAWIKAELVGGKTYSVSTGNSTESPLFFAFDETGSYCETLYGRNSAFTPQKSGTYYLGVCWGMDQVVVLPAGADVKMKARSELPAPASETLTVTLTSAPARQVLKGTISVPEFVTDAPWAVMAIPLDVDNEMMPMESQFGFGLVSGISKGNQIDYQFQGLPEGNYAVFAIIDSNYYSNFPEELFGRFLMGFLGGEESTPGLYLAGGSYRTLLEVGRDLEATFESGELSFLEKLSTSVSETGVTTHNLLAFPLTVNSANLPVTYGDPADWTEGALDLGVDALTGASVAQYVTPVVPRSTYTISWQSGWDGGVDYEDEDPVVVSAMAETADGTLRTIFTQEMAGYGYSHEPWVVETGPSDKSLWLIVQALEKRGKSKVSVLVGQSAPSRVVDGYTINFAVRIDEGVVPPWADKMEDLKKLEQPFLPF